MFLRKMYGLLPVVTFLVCGTIMGEFSVSAQDVSSGEGNFANFQEAPVDLVLDTYEILSGKHLIREKGVSTAPTINLNSHGLSKVDTLKLIESTLMLNGLIIVPIDDQTSKIILSSATRNARSEGTKIYANPADFPPGEEVISYYMPLTYITPKEAQEIFTQHTPPHPYGAYVPAPSSQAIILTENTGTIRQLIALQELIDVPPTPVVNESVQLENSNAVDVAAMVNKLLDSRRDLSSASQLGESLSPASTSPLMIVPGEDNMVIGPTRIVPDSRSNRIFIITRPYNLPFLEGLISRLDEPGEFMTPQRRQLRFVQALDILPALQATLAQGKEEVTDAKSEQETISNRNNLAASNAAATNADIQSIGSTTPPLGATGAPTSSTSITPRLKAPSPNNVPQVVTVGRTRLMADNQSNSIIVFGSANAVNKVFGMIDELDRQPLQVYLSTIIGQLTVSKGTEFGVDLLQKYVNTGKSGIAASSISSPRTTSVSNIPDPTSLMSNLGFPISSGLTLYGVIGNQVNSYIRALESTNRFQVISRPSVFTTNNKLAVIASGSQIPVPASTTSGVTGTGSDLSTTSSIQYENVLLQLDIIPLINADHQVTLKIRQTNNSLGDPQVISGNSIPSILTQEINTEVTLQDKATVVIGGLISETKRKGTTGIPWLSSIPLLGNLFKDTTNSEERDELIIMIQPTVIENEGDRLAASESEKRRAVLYQELIKTEQNIPTTSLGDRSKMSSPYPRGKTPTSAFPLTPAPQADQPPPYDNRTPSVPSNNPPPQTSPTNIPDYILAPKDGG